MFPPKNLAQIILLHLFKAKVDSIIGNPAIIELDEFAQLLYKSLVRITRSDC
jgi:hypothetical protein